MGDSPNQFNYQLGEVVWAKVNGYPWWPALVESISNQIVTNDFEEKKALYKVNFFAHNSCSYLSEDKLAKYQEKYQENTSHKRVGKKLKASIDMADDHLSSSMQTEDLLCKIEPMSSSQVDCLLVKQEDGASSLNASLIQTKIQPERVQDISLIEFTPPGHSTAEEGQSKLQSDLEQKNQRPRIKRPKFKKVRVNQQNVVELLESGYYERYGRHFNDGLMAVKLKNKLKRMLLAKYKLQKHLVHGNAQPNHLKRNKYIKKSESHPSISFSRVESSSESSHYVEEEKSAITNFEFKRPFVRKIYEILKTKGMEYCRAKHLSQFLFDRVLTFSSKQGIHKNFYNLLCFLYHALPEQLNCSSLMNVQSTNHLQMVEPMLLDCE